MSAWGPLIDLPLDEQSWFRDLIFFNPVWKEIYVSISHASDEIEI